MKNLAEVVHVDTGIHKSGFFLKIGGFHVCPYDTEHVAKSTADRINKEAEKWSDERSKTIRMQNAAQCGHTETHMNMIKAIFGIEDDDEETNHKEKK